MKILLRIILILIFYIFFPINSVLAGGGRIVIQNIGNTSAYTGSQVNLTFKVYHEGSGNDAVSTNERLEFRIENPRAGDYCSTYSLRSNEQGEISGYCTASAPGDYLMYVYSLEKNDESSRVYVSFISPPTATPTPISPTLTSDPLIDLTPTPTEYVAQTNYPSVTDIPITLTNTYMNISPTTISTEVKGRTIDYKLTTTLIIFLLVVLVGYFYIGRKLFKNTKNDSNNEEIDNNKIKEENKN